MEPIKTNPPNHNEPKDGASQVAVQARKSAGMDAGKDASKDVDLVNDAKGIADKVVGQARGLVSSQIDKQKESSAGELGKVAHALRQSGEGLSDTMAGPYIEKAAAMIDRVSGSVRNANLRDSVRSTERFARREPLLFLGGAFAIGLLAARFLKSSAHEDEPADGQLMLQAGGQVPRQPHVPQGAGRQRRASGTPGPGGNRGRDGGY